MNMWWCILGVYLAGIAANWIYWLADWTAVMEGFVGICKRAVPDGDESSMRIGAVIAMFFLSVFWPVHLIRVLRALSR